MRAEIKFKDPDFNDVETWMRQCFDELLSLVRDRLSIQPQDKVGFSFQNAQNNNKSNFHISFRRFDQLSSEVILAALDSVLQSNSYFLANDDNILVNVDHVQIPVGCGRRSFIGKSTQDFLNIHKNAIYSPQINDEDGNICLPVAILIGMAYADGARSQNLYNFLTYNGNHSELISRAKSLALVAGVDYENGCGVDEIRKFQHNMSGRYRINVYNSRDGRSVYFQSNIGNAPQISLLLDNGHYNVIKSLTAVFSCSYFCSYCACPYTTRIQHRNCPFKCDRCFHSPPCEKGIQLKCDGCNRTFVSNVCFDRHIKTKICFKVRICSKCLVSYCYEKKTPHVCGTKYCTICKSVKPIRHECFIICKQPRKRNPKGVIQIFFDLECTQSQAFNCDNAKFEHIPNLCVVHQSCNGCSDKSNIRLHCENCGIREHIFSETNVIKNFMAYLGQLPENFKRIVVIAHNFQKYDGHFILQYMYQNPSEWNLKPESLIMNGSKILQIKVGRFRFIDSLNFFSVALAELPTMFQLNCKSKGYYPHYFNTSENFNYVGPMPDPKFYGVDSMKGDDRKVFLEWYEKQKENIFDNKLELVKYCKQDVNILRLACLKFKLLLIELTGVDPFDQITIAGTCMAIFKSNFLKPDLIAIVPSNGYRMRENQSFKALKWIEWVSYTNDIKIVSALNGREVRIANDIVVDGFYNGTVFEFLGCYWHQCPKCFPFKYHNTPNSFKLSPVRTQYELTLLRNKKIERMGYKLVQIWEHEFDEMMKTNEVMCTYLNSLTYLKNEPLNPRDAFFGGRTGVCKLYHKVNPGERILYYDVTSLYPYVNKYKDYPAGVPEILIGKELIDRTVYNINGIIKCLVLPPKSLYHPVLPIKMHSKLLFGLCYKCMIDKNCDECEHNDNERSFVGTYIAEELRIAVDKGYKIIEIYEAWEYQMTKYDKVTNEGGIFAEYINTFLKIKTEASGYPSWCKSTEDKEKFVQLFHEKEGILLEEDSIEKNPGLRSLSKLCLNSLWGKFGERKEKIKKMFINERDQLLNLITDPSYETQSFYSLSSDAILASYRLLDESEMKQPNVNVVIAAYTTAHARLHLYSYLDKLKEKVLYYDTDSVFFIKNQNDEGLALGDYLGDLTDELCEYSENCYINEIVFSSEKSYAYTVMSNEGIYKGTVCKVKGICLNHENSQHVNFNSMKELVLKGEYENSDLIKFNTNTIQRSGDSTVYTTKKEYTFKVNARKRRRVGDESICTLPYGFKRINNG